MPAPKKNTAYTFYAGLVSQASRPQFQSNPTLASGDFKISIDGGAFANLGTLPAVTPASGRAVKFVLSADEMNGDSILVQCVDAAGAEWDDLVIYIDTTVVTVDDLVRSTTPANTLDVSAAGNAGIDWANVASPTTSVALTGTTIATTQKVDIETIKTQAVTCSGGVTVPAATLASTTNITAGTITTATNLTTNNDKTGYGLSAAAVLAVWDALTSALTTVGSIGKRLADDIDAAITSRLAPTTAGRTLDVAATGEAGLDFDNVKDASGAHTLTNITVPVVTTVGTLTTYTGNTVQTGDAFARLGAPAGASVSVDMAAVKSDTAAILVDTGTTLDGRIPAALSAAGNMKSDALALNGSTAAAAALAILNGSTVIYQGTVTGAATTSTLIDSGLTQADADWWKGRIIIFTSVIALQATDITAFDPATDKLTFTAVTSAPTGATYVII